MVKSKKNVLRDGLRQRSLVDKSRSPTTSSQCRQYTKNPLDLGQLIPMLPDERTAALDRLEADVRKLRRQLADDALAEGHVTADVTLPEEPHARPDRLRGTEERPRPPSEGLPCGDCPLVPGFRSVLTIVAERGQSRFRGTLSCQNCWRTAIFALIARVSVPVTHNR